MTTPFDWPAFPSSTSDSAPGLSAKEFAALQLRVPDSGTDWLDDMIAHARLLDAQTQLAAAMIGAGDRTDDEIQADAWNMAVDIVTPPETDPATEEPAA